MITYRIWSTSTRSVKVVINLLLPFLRNRRGKKSRSHGTFPCVAAWKMMFPARIFGAPLSLQKGTFRLPRMMNRKKWTILIPLSTKTRRNIFSLTVKKSTITVSRMGRNIERQSLASLALKKWKTPLTIWSGSPRSMKKTGMSASKNRILIMIFCNRRRRWSRPFKSLKDWIMRIRLKFKRETRSLPNMKRN